MFKCLCCTSGCDYILLFLTRHYWTLNSLNLVQIILNSSDVDSIVLYVSFQTLLQNEVFHQCMFACSLEIVIYSYNSPRKFPWILEALNLKASNFYKVIELIVRTKDQLSRDVVKHLNSIEEQVLESLAWTSDSPLWQSIIASNAPIPSCEDTSLPGQLDDGAQQASNLNIRRMQTPTSSSEFLKLHCPN